MRALLVDLDDTLLDYSGGVDACWDGACTAVGAFDVVERPTLLAALVETRHWFWSDPRRHRRERVDMLGAWRQIAAGALERCRVPDAGLAAAMAEEYRARRHGAMTLFPDALSCLQSLRATGTPLALITNGDAREQRDKIERYGLAPFFQAIVIEGEFGAGKPDAVVYRSALDVLGIPAVDAAMVGDHLEFDVAGPQAVGVAGIWLDRHRRGLPAGSAVRPARIIVSLGELCAPASAS